MRPIGAQAVRLVLAGSLALGAASAGCTWRRDLRPLYPATLPADQRVEVWRFLRDDSAQNQCVARAGHGDVEQAQFLAP